jgi:antitoxin HicB
MATKVKDLAYYMALPYTVCITPPYDDDPYWFAEVKELDGCMTWTETRDELDSMIEDAKATWIESALKHSDPIPEPLYD